QPVRGCREPPGEPTLGAAVSRARVDRENWSGCDGQTSLFEHQSRALALTPSGVQSRPCSFNIDSRSACKLPLNLFGDVSIIPNLMRELVVRFERDHQIDQRASSVGCVAGNLLRSTRAREQGSPERVLKQDCQIKPLLSYKARIANEVDCRSYKSLRVADRYHLVSQSLAVE